MKQVHIYGTSLGGFLAQIFAQLRPRRVKSLVLSNTFLETHKFAAAMPWSPVYVFFLFEEAFVRPHNCFVINWSYA
jgi:pimeloyl-ACP methyl ester carboxylesterase